jgi:hypothetical protein
MHDDSRPSHTTYSAGAGRCRRGQPDRRGASSRNAGHLPAGTKHDPDKIIARHSAAAGQRLIDAAEQGRTSK